MHPIPVQATANPVGQTGLMSRLLFFGLLGFLTLVLFGPVVGVLSAVLSVIIAVVAVCFALALAVLPFALIGLVAQGVFNGVAGRDRVGATFSQHMNQLGQGFSRFFRTAWSWSYHAMHWTCVKGLAGLTLAGNAVRRSYAWTQRVLLERGRAAFRVVFEAACGAIIATGVCLAASGGALEAIPFGVIGGALIGGAVGWPKRVERGGTVIGLAGNHRAQPRTP
jgi:hypothetical protein